MRGEHFEVMKDGAIVCNSGHFNVEIDIPALEKLSVEAARRSAQFVEEYTHGGRPPHLPAGRGPAGQPGGGRGPPGGVMDMSFANQALPPSTWSRTTPSLEKKVYAVPKEIDNEIARLKLKTHGHRDRHADRGAGQVPRSWDEGT